MLKLVYIFAEGERDNQRLVEAVEEGADWWKQLTDDQKNEYRLKAHEAFEAGKEPKIQRGNKFVYEITSIDEGIRVAPWWDSYTQPREYLDRMRVQYYDPISGEPLNPEGQSGSTERK